MEYKTAILSNGLRILHLPSSSPVVYCGYVIAFGTRDERPAEEGLAHFCEHMSFNGTARRRAWQIRNCLENVGGDLNASTGKETTKYNCLITNEYVPQAVDVLTDIVFHSVYPQSEIKKEADVICSEIEDRNESPCDLIFDDFENMIFKGHPLGHDILGTSELVHRYTSADALNFTRRGYLPQNAVFCSTGDINFSRLVKRLEKATSDFPAAAPIMKEGTTVLPEQQKGIITENHNNIQAQVVMGTRSFKTKDDRLITLAVLNSILSECGSSARLNLILREKRGLVYGVETYSTGFNETGLWNINFSCEHKDTKRCLRLINNELARYVDKPISQYRLDAIKKIMKGQMKISLDFRENRMFGSAKRFLFTGKPTDIEEQIRNIDKVTAEDIQSVAAEIFDPDNMLTLIYE